MSKEEDNATMRMHPTADELKALGFNARIAGVDELTPHPLNYNRHSSDQVGELSQSLNDFDQYKNAVVWLDPDNGILYILAGHGLWEAAKAEGRTDIIVNDRSDLTRAEAMALMVSDNFTPSVDFDYTRLAGVVQDDEFPKNVPGVDVAAILEMAAVEEVGDGVADVEPQVDKAEELQEKWGVAEGDIWQAGPHYVICGDCRESDTWRRLLAKSGHDKVNGVFTSPPYAEQRKKQYGGTPTDEYVEWWDAVQENVKGHLADDGSFFVNIKPHCKDGERVLYVFDLVLAMRRRWGWRFVDELCWFRKSGPKAADYTFKNWFEPVYHFSNIKKSKMRPGNVVVEFSDKSGRMEVYGGKNSRKVSPSSSGAGVKSKVFDGALPSNVIDTRAVGESAQFQAATFPIALPDFFIRAYSDPGDVWLDPFLGSGTTIVAAHQADGGQRVGLGIERLPKYVSVCLERFAGLGLEPERVSQ